MAWWLKRSIQFMTSAKKWFRTTQFKPSASVKWRNLFWKQTIANFVDGCALSCKSKLCMQVNINSISNMQQGWEPQTVQSISITVQNARLKLINWTHLWMGMTPRATISNSNRSNKKISVNFRESKHTWTIIWVRTICCTYLYHKFHSLQDAAEDTYRLRS